MSILKKYDEVFMNKDEAGMNEVLHDDYKFTMHASGKVLTKQDVIQWAMSDDINRDKVRIIYENDEIGIEHSFVTFSDGNTQAVMAVFTFKDGKIFSLESSLIYLFAIEILFFVEILSIFNFNKRISAVNVGNCEL